MEYYIKALYKIFLLSDFDFGYYTKEFEDYKLWLIEMPGAINNEKT